MFSFGEFELFDLKMVVYYSGVAMSRIKPRNTEEICTQNSALGAILNKSKLLSQLNRLVKKHLPTSLQEHVSVANYRDDCLVLGVTKSAFLTELRYREGVILEALKKDDLPQLKAVESIILMASSHL